MRRRDFDGAKFRARRQALALTQQQVADRAQVSLSFVKYVENGKSQPSDQFATFLAAAVESTPEALSTAKPGQPRKPKAA